MRRPLVVFVPPSCCGAGYFRKLRRALADRVDFRAVELPGHGRRFAEPLVMQAKAAVADLAALIGGPVDAVYGESLGAYVGLALAGALDQHRPPLLLAAANSPPSVRDRIPLEDIDSIESAAATLAAMGGRIPADVLADRDVAGHAYPLIRADLYLSQSFIETTRALTVAADIQVLAGVDDTASTGLQHWARHTTGRCAVTRLPGGHLLSETNPAGVAGLIEQVLSRR